MVSTSSQEAILAVSGIPVHLEWSYKEYMEVGYDLCGVPMLYIAPPHQGSPAEVLGPKRRFDHINMDLDGHLLPSHRFTQLLTTVNGTTWWPEAGLLSLTTSAGEV